MGSEDATYARVPGPCSHPSIPSQPTLFAVFAYTASSGTTESALVYLQVMPNANQWANLIIIMAYAPFLHMLSLASYVRARLPTRFIRA